MIIKRRKYPSLNLKNQVKGLAPNKHIMCRKPLRFHPRLRWWIWQCRKPDHIARKFIIWFETRVYSLRFESTYSSFYEARPCSIKIFIRTSETSIKNFVFVLVRFWDRIWRLTSDQTLFFISILSFSGNYPLSLARCICQIDFEFLKINNMLLGLVHICMLIWCYILNLDI